MKNRRAHTRVPVPEGALTATMPGRRGDVEGYLIDASAGGIRALFPPRPEAVATIGSDIELTLSGPGLVEPLRVEVRVCHRDDNDSGSAYGFQLDDPTSLPDRIPESLLAMFNRRVELRVSHKEPLDITIQLSTYSADGHHTASAKALDLSTVGMAVIVDASAEWMFATTRYVTAAIQLASPGQSPPIAIECQIRNRKLIDKGVRYGLRFVEKRTDQFAIKQWKIVEYLGTESGDLG